MAHQIGFVDNTGSEGLAHWQMLLLIKTTAEANGWTTLRYNTAAPGGTREWIAKGVGLSGTEKIYVGVRTYHSVSADYYNFAFAVFTGYVAGNTWENQPGIHDQALCGHNQRIDYWLAVNAQRVLLGMKVGTPVYEVGYAGKYLPYATPGQYPYPVAVIGTLQSGMPAQRYSDITVLGPNTHGCGIRRNFASIYYSNGRFRDVAGTWGMFDCTPWLNDSTTRRDTSTFYLGMAAALATDTAIMGELDGLRYVSGFNNVTENTTTIGSVQHVILQDVFRTGIGDYMLLEMN